MIAPVTLRSLAHVGALLAQAENVAPVDSRANPFRGWRTVARILPNLHPRIFLRRLTGACWRTAASADAHPAAAP
jgi:hypothetical protein